jgi:hypothetical protein
MRRELERIEIPGEHDARERTWAILQTAFAERAPARRRPLHLRPAIALAVALALLAAALSSPGMAVLDRIRKSVGIEHAAPALFSLPSPGKLLVRTDAGVWVVQEDGSRRFVGSYREASWSPFGRFIVATRRNELTALEPDGHVHWTLARPTARLASWGGTRNDTRIAYVSGKSLRVVAGDGTGDRSSCADVVAGVDSAWQPGSTRHLAFAAPNGAVQVYAVDTCRRLWRTRPGPAPTKLEWSGDGRRLLVVAPPGLRVYDVRGRLVARDDPSDATRDVDATFVSGRHGVVAIRLHGHQSDVLTLFATPRSLFHVAGTLAELVASPTGRWLLVTWPTADQWIFVRSDGRGIRAVSNISRQFDSQTFPRVEGWAP